jgi:hypothetical protein
MDYVAKSFHFHDWDFSSDKALFIMSLCACYVISCIILLLHFICQGCLYQDLNNKIQIKDVAYAEELPVYHEYFSADPS